MAMNCYTKPFSPLQSLIFLGEQMRELLQAFLIDGFGSGGGVQLRLRT